MKSIILYKGKYGATEQYAKWLSEALNIPAMQPADYKKTEIDNCDSLIIGTSVYIGTMLIKQWLKENLAYVSGKKIFLFAVCGTPPGEKEKLDSYIRSSIPEEIRNRITYYFLPGKLVYKNLSLFDKFILRMGSVL